MADQSVRIANMPSIPSPGSAERVAYDLWHYLKYMKPDGTSRDEFKKQMLDLYAECLRAAKGLRDCD